MRLSYKSRKRLPSSSFVFPRGTKAVPGRRAFPIKDRKHARNALARAAQKKTKLTGAERCRVVKVVCSRFPDIGVCAGASRSRKLSRCKR